MITRGFTARFNLYLAFFAVGYAALVAQVVLTREFLVILNGNELCIGLILSSWLFGIGLGAWIGAILADKIRFARAIFLTGLLAMAITPPVQIAVIRGARGLLGVGVGEAIPLLTIMWFCPVITSLTSLLVGFLFPFAGRLSAEAGEDAVAGVADLYMVESLGSLLGGLLFTFALVGLLRPMQVASLNAGVLAVGGFAIALTYDTTIRRNLIAGIFIALAVLAGLAFPDASLHWDRGLERMRWRQTVKDMHLRESVDSRYQHLAIGRYDDQYSLFANGAFAGYAPADYSHAQLAHFLLSQHPEPEELLLIGNGAEGMLPSLVKYPVRKIDYVLQDDMVLKLLNPVKSNEQLHALNDPRVNIDLGDGRGFLQTTSQKYDLIIALVPPPSNALLNRYFTQDFFRQVRSHLNPKGAFIIPLPMTPNYIGGIVGSYVGSINEALKSVFPEIVYGYLPQDFAFCAIEPGVVTTDFSELSRRWQSRGLTGESFHEVLFRDWLDPYRVAQRRAQIDALPESGGNSDLLPTAYFYRLLIWNRTSSSERSAADAINNFILGLRGLSVWPLIAVILIFLAISLVVRQTRGGVSNRFIGLFVISSTGFTAIAIEILLIFTYQNLFGYIYHEIGLIVAAFMAGLALGAWWMRKPKIQGAAGLRNKLLKFEIGILVLCVSLVLGFLLGEQISAVAAFGTRYLTFVLLVSAGLLTGAEFPLAVALFMKSKQAKVGAGAGAIDSADHIGATLGAAATGVLLVPIFGLWPTAILLVCLKATSSILVIRN